MYVFTSTYMFNFHPQVSIIDFIKFADCVALPGYPLDKIIILKQTPQDIIHRNTCLLYLMTFPGRYMANSMYVATLSMHLTNDISDSISI